MTTATADALIDRVLANGSKTMEDGPFYVFNSTYDDGELVLNMTIDQSKPVGERVVAMTPSPDTLDGDAAKTAEMIRARTRGDIWCTSFAENIPADARRVSETDTTATYTFTPLPGKSDGQMGKAFKFLDGKVEVDKESASILSFEMVAPKPFKPMMVAKVDRFSMKVACTKSPDGRTHMASMNMDLLGKAMMQDLKQTETRKISGLVPVASSGTGSK